jgi:hypothetical protein
MDFLYLQSDLKYFVNLSFKKFIFIIENYLLD